MTHATPLMVMPQRPHANGTQDSHPQEDGSEEQSDDGFYPRVFFNGIGPVVSVHSVLTCAVEDQMDPRELRFLEFLSFGSAVQSARIPHVLISVLLFTAR